MTPAGIGRIAMIVRTTVFELCNGKYRNLSELARAMDISVSQVYRVREGKRNINQKFIVGAIRAFPECRFSDLFYIAPDDSRVETTVTVTYSRYRSALPVSQMNK
jgi:hypothetical protein